MYSVIELNKYGLIQIEKFRTVEEAYDLMGKLINSYPNKKYDVLEIA